MIFLILTQHIRVRHSNLRVAVLFRFVACSRLSVDTAIKSARLPSRYIKAGTWGFVSSRPLSMGEPDSFSAETASLRGLLPRQHS